VQQNVIGVGVFMLVKRNFAYPPAKNVDCSEKVFVKRQRCLFKML